MLLQIMSQSIFCIIINKVKLNKNLMQRIVRLLQKTPFKSKMFYMNSTDKNLTQITPLNKPLPQFPDELYGLKLDHHILFNRKMELPEDQYKFYQKNSPNYLVVLIKKALNNAQALVPKNENQSALDQFYSICSYCHVKYLPNDVISLQKVHRVHIENIQTRKIHIPTKQQQESQASTAITVQTTEQKQDEAITNSPYPRKQKSTIRQLLKKTNSLNRLSITQDKLAYWLKIRQIKQPPLQINSSLQISYTYLLDLFSRASHHQFNQINLNLNIKDINTSLDLIAANQIPYSKKEHIQAYLEAHDPQQKINLLLWMLQKNTNLSKYFMEIQNQAKNSIRGKKYSEYYSQMMKITKQALDGKKAKQLFIEKCVANFKKMNPSKEITQVFAQEIERYDHIDENSIEDGVVKAYIQELSKIPYDVKSQEVFDLEAAQKIMDEDHYGMKDVKDAILEVIAVGKLKKSLKGKIFCFIGGPGLGKTSFSKSVAKALNRKFYSISLGGVTDSSVLKGHRRTYIGAYSGKIIQALKACGTNNPVILLDQIDKMGSSYHGDPRSQLLQILDPNQNNTFMDNFVDVPVDLSNVLFITSANYERNISKPLLDRMEKIYLTSYTKFEKVQIFNKHLLPRAIQKSGVQPHQFSLPPDVIDTLVEEYSLGEPGVRYLEKHALSLMQKIAYKMLMKQEELPIKVTKQNLHQYMGNSFYRVKDHTKVGKGVAISLGGGNYGSRLTYIEAFKKSYISRKQIARGMIFTGSLGDVFKQAMSISYTFARNYLLSTFNNKYLYENQVHVHAPEGASKKDGSTDSLTIVAALLSLALSVKVKPGVAMTGEVTLHGHILRTHNIKQKIMVASRQKISEVILPKENEPDVENLPENIKQNIKFHYISRFEEAFPYLFPEYVQSQTLAQASA